MTNLGVFLSAFLVIVTTELGDKTFIITTILAMKYSRKSVFLGAMTAAGLMITISILIGVISTLIPKIFVHYLSIGLFAFFGIQMLREGISMDAEEEEEELKKTLEEINEKTRKASTTTIRVTAFETTNREESEKQKNEVENSDSQSQRDALKAESRKVASHHHQDNHQQHSLWDISFLLSPIFLETFTMNFFAEWGDKSQISTIFLAAKENAFILVMMGALTGQLVCNAIAVLGGGLIGKVISTKTGIHPFLTSFLSSL